MGEKDEGGKEEAMKTKEEMCRLHQRRHGGCWSHRGGISRQEQIERNYPRRRSHLNVGQARRKEVESR